MQADVPASHIATAQWQSFEMRMRKRRAARCVLRAEVALEAGFEEDARLALEEARKLDRNVPAFEMVQAAARERLEAAARAERTLRIARVRRLTVAAALFIALIGGGAAFFWPQGSGANSTATAAPASTPSSAPPVAARAAIAAPAIARPLTLVVREPGPSEDARDVTESNTEPPKKPDEPPAPVIPIAFAEPLPVAPPPGTPPPPIADATPTAGIGAITAVPEPPAAAPTEREAKVDDAPNEASRIRAVLGRYESAYSRLNAAAAQAVWPGVDARSLARAFDGLESQRISLGECEVSIDGAEAHADCDGTATWTPKVGGSGRTEARHWAFDLKNNGSAWQIVSAQVR